MRLAFIPGQQVGSSNQEAAGQTMTQASAGPGGARPREYWKYNIRLTTFTMIVWFAVSFGAILFAPQLNGIVIFGFPLGYYLGAQGSLTVFVVLVFNYAFRMNRADIDFGVGDANEQ